MQITQPLIQNLQVSFSQIFERAYQDVPQFWDMISTPIPSTTLTNTYGWLSRLPAMREWIGPKVVQNISTQQYSLINRDFELTFGVKRNDILDDQLGIFNPLVSSAARQVGRLWNDLVIEAITNGAVTTGPGGAAFDGLAFFANHTGSGGKFAVANNTGSENLTPGGWNAVVEKMAAFTGEDGRNLNVRPDTIVIPAVGGYERAARTMFTVPLQTGGQSNILFSGAPRVIVTPELPSSFGWLALDTSKGISPFIVQQRQQPTMVARTAPTDDNVFYLAEFLWSIEARGAAGYGPYFLAYKATGTSPDGREAPKPESASPA